MCGILFTKSDKPIDKYKFEQALLKQKWRGPDAIGLIKENKGVYLGHVRLSILGLSNSCNQPMPSMSNRLKIIYNGEIYNHKELRKKFNIKCKTESDTETILEAFEKIGPEIFEHLDGMFALVIYEVNTGSWWAVRDKFGIKPMYIYQNKSNNTVIISSETISIRNLVNCTISEESINEWNYIRRPIPSKTFFNEIDEVMPGTILKNNRTINKLKIQANSNEDVFNQEKLENIVKKSIRNHELSHVTNVSLLSGGIDSSLITAISKCKKAYTIGLNENNEIPEARDTANNLSKKLVEVNVKSQQMLDSWNHLIKLRGEPLSVPNEGLIYLVCKNMKFDEKVVLTGEGADEIFFGYDRIFRKAISLKNKMAINTFYKYYCYSNKKENKKTRLYAYIENFMFGKNNIVFIEDFFMKIHLTGLLRRMDMASMAASKEARVPFVTDNLIRYMYKRSSEIKINEKYSKIPLRVMCEKLKLNKVISRKKIGFSSSYGVFKNKYDEYNSFREINLKALKWL